MTYLAINQGTCDWLLGKPNLIEEIKNAALSPSDGMLELGESEFAEGPVRIASAPSTGLVAIWNSDYLSGTGEEAWGFIKLDSELGLSAHLEISAEVFERELYLINQRLQGLLVDAAFFHRSYSNGSHSCLAGRGTTARQFSVGYMERVVETETAPRRAVLCLGPSTDFSRLMRQAGLEGEQLPSLVLQANALATFNRRKTPASESMMPVLREALRAYTRIELPNEFRQVQIETQTSEFQSGDQFRALGFSYEQWISRGSPLTDVQRRILQLDVIDSHPLRIVGPGGSGKTLLMQLLAVRRLRAAQEQKRPVRILYITHNSAMAESVAHRFEVLDQEGLGRRTENQVIDITTLAEYGRKQLGLEYTSVIDPDAFEAKRFQLEQVTLALSATMDEMPGAVQDSRLFSEVSRNDTLLEVLAKLIMAEISIGIKGHGLEADKRRYVESERALSRLHGILNQSERGLVFHVFQHYVRAVFEELEVLDTDDIALSLLGRLRTPIWELKRKSLGYDYVFVDETQLFNENERRVLPLLTRGTTSHVPIAMALDEAQDVFGHSQATAGLATLGIPDITNESLASIHRSTRAIVRLAFFVIQRSTDLFGTDFPDFTSIADFMEEDSHPLAISPKIEVVGGESRSLGKFVVKRISELRRANLRRIAVICHSELYWEPVLSELRATQLPLHVLLDRGAKLPTDSPVVVATRPVLAGGQEFDAVILVGLEQGLVPPRVLGNDALAAAVEQQSLRELYLAITRARYRLLVVVGAGATASSVIQDAERAGLIGRA